MACIALIISPQSDVTDPGFDWGSGTAASQAVLGGDVGHDVEVVAGSFGAAQGYADEQRIQHGRCARRLVIASCLNPSSRPSATRTS